MSPNSDVISKDNNQTPSTPDCTRRETLVNHRDSRTTVPDRLDARVEGPSCNRWQCTRHPHSEQRFPAPSSKLQASLSGNFLQTPSIAFRHLPPNSKHRFPATSSKLRASLSGNFLQTLPYLVTPLKGYLYLRAAVQRRGQRPLKRFLY